MIRLLNFLLVLALAAAGFAWIADRPGEVSVVWLGQRYETSVAVALLGVLAGSGLNAAKDYGYLIIAMRPDLLLPLADFKRDLSEQLARIKAVPRQEGVTEIRLPSEKSFHSRERALREGIRIDRLVHTRLLALAAHQTVQP
jgi:LDH2 family malate/lactate/ureidoglycolate dehydrogenase